MIFTPKIRDNAIETTCSNLIMAGLLQPTEVCQYMITITKYDNIRLAFVLIESRLLLDKYYESNAKSRRN